MKQEDNRMKKVADILDSLDGMSRAGADPHLYTRIRARLEDEQSIWSGIASFLSRPMVAFSLILLLMAVNTLIIIQSAAPPAEENPDQLTALAQEYRFEKTTMLDQNTTLP